MRAGQKRRAVHNKWCSRGNGRPKPELNFNPEGEAWMCV